MPLRAALRLVLAAPLVLAACTRPAAAPDTTREAPSSAAAASAASSADAGAAPASTAGSTAAATVDPTLPVAHVYKSATCGCCRLWVDHLRAEGFKVEVTDTPDLAAIKTRLGVPAGLGSCHTARIGDYTVEGHVPAADIKRLLATRPAGVAGIGVPGMPLGSPGMEVPGQPADAYNVVAFGPDGEAVFARH